MLRPSVCVAVVVVAGVVGGGCDLPAVNPFDPDAPADLQARAKVRGQVRAIFARDADGEPGAAGACDRVDPDEDDGDHAGFRIVLRGVRDGGAGLSALSAETNETGLFEFIGVPPGPYTLEILRDGFDLPPAAEVVVGAGDDRDLGAFCAINETGPAAPTLAPLPDLVRGSDAAPSIVILDDDDCDAAAAGCAVSWQVTQTQEGGTSVVNVLDDTDAATAVVTGRADADPARFDVRISVIARDALGNASAATEVVVVVDDLAPLPPLQAPPVAGRDRVTVSFEPAAAAEGDDAAASFFVSYGVVVRGDDDENAADRDDCDHGRPRFDDDGNIVDENGRASFALEGPSPLATTTTTQTLSGIAAGTDVVVHVAAVDAAGNAGCYGPPALARPDVVVLEGARTRGGVTANVQRAAFIDGLTDGVVAVARGAGGLTLLDHADVATTDATPTHDVVADGRRFVSAVGALGVRVSPIDEDGQVVAADVETFAVAGADVRAVALRPGVAIAGTVSGATGGIAIVDLDDGSSDGVVDVGANVVDVASWGDMIVVATTAGIQLRQRAAPATVVATLAQGSIREIAIHDDAVVAALGDRGLAVYDLAPCSTSAIDGAIDGGVGCLAVRSRRVLALGGVVLSVAAFDEFVVANVAEADRDGDGEREGVLLTFDPRRALATVGRAPLVAAAGSVLVDDGLVCSAGGNAVVDCRSPISGLADEERRLVTAGDVRRARAAAGTAVAFEDGDVAGVAGFVVRAPLATMVATSRAALPGSFVVDDDRIINPVGGVVLADGRVVVVDGLARVFVVAPGLAGPVALVGSLAPDLLALFGDLDDENAGSVLGFVELLGGQLLLALTTSADDHAFVRVALQDGPAGLALGDVEVLALPDAEQNTNLVLRRGQAFVPTRPFGVVIVDVDEDALAEAAGSVAPGVPGTPGQADDVAFVAVDGAATSGFVIGSQGADVAGLFVLDDDGAGGIGDEVGAPAVVDDANAMVALQRFAVVSSRALGVVTLLADVPGGQRAFVPVLDVPSASQVEDTRATARGLLVSDSAGGVLRVTLR